jgi:hypothetical protein
MYVKDENELAQLLREAAVAHHSFEVTLGHPDEAWPEWYARHIAAAIEAGEQKGPADKRSGSKSG